ncbi:uncharacterized protein E5676_scaffold945G00230 [Cucumis melo var. makuwa]|uniref:Ty3-gypsy retrotransposon protein n=1 Tax=Cucumis melo var. makuwa TaxID=1194695 RepID=A0A5D3D5K8_CUCMM|nr:uncharacterized protein E6C27_scaffold673G00240 [Cucumis melo var. makuwa]TYK18805.1 uncharacterized protein E5676_scaffold945G00230 [Cucumis melo var. makuwa]
MKGTEKIVNSTMKESRVIITTPLKFSKRKEGRAEKNDDGSERRCLALKERQEKVYPFPNLDIADMLEQLLEKQLIQLPGYKRPELAREKKIELDLEEDENLEVIACHAINATEEESIPPRSLEEEGVSKDLSRFNVDDLLSLPRETKTILINALLNSAVASLSAPTAIYEKSRRILIDNGSAVNIMSKSTMRQLGILMDELSNSKLASALFHVIDSKTTYKLLLGRPWIYGNGVVMSTLHQCFKFYQDGVKKVDVDSNPFSEVESHFADAKFYLKNDNSPEVVPVEISLLNREDHL